MALSRLYNRSIVVYNEVNKAVQEQVFISLQDEERGCTVASVDELECPVKMHAHMLMDASHCVPFSCQILLAYSDGNHYDSVYSAQYMDNMSFCQGIMLSKFVYLPVLTV